MNYFDISFKNLNNQSEDIQTMCNSFNHMQNELNDMLDILSSSILLVSNSHISLTISYAQQIKTIEDFYKYVYSYSKDNYRLLFTFNKKHIAYRLNYHDFFIDDRSNNIGFKELQYFNNSLEELKKYIDLELIHTKFKKLERLGVDIFNSEKKYNQRNVREKASFIGKYFKNMSVLGSELNNFSDEEYIKLHLIYYIEGNEMWFRSVREIESKCTFLLLKIPDNQSVEDNGCDLDYIQEKIIELNPEFFNSLLDNHFSVKGYDYYSNFCRIQFEFEPFPIDNLYEKVVTKSNIENF